MSQILWDLLRENTALITAKSMSITCMYGTVLYVRFANPET